VAALGRHKYAVLLALLLVSLAIQSVDAGADAAELVSNGSRTVLGVAIFLDAHDDE